MRLVNYRIPGQGQRHPSSVGVLLDGRVGDVNTILNRSSVGGCDGRRERYQSLDEVLRAGILGEISGALENHEDDSRPRRENWIELSSLRLLPTVLHPTKVIGVGMNYHSFTAQLGMAAPSHPVLFHKTSSALCGHGQEVVIPGNTRQPVPEGELAVVIGRRADRIAPSEADRHIAGYTCANDISARDLEFQTSQWTNGKMLPTFGPLGPALVTPDEIDDIGNLELRTVLNGITVQHGNTGNMVFPVRELISLISMLVTLEPGDVVLTGTPSDLGANTPPTFLSPGDMVEVRIAGLGHLKNPVVAAGVPQRDPYSKGYRHSFPKVDHGIF